MNKIKDYIKHLSQFTIAKQDEELLTIVKSFEPQIIDLNTSQLMNGENANGIQLRPYASVLYSNFKRGLNPKGVTDLNLTGKFHRLFFLDADQFPVTINSSDDKATTLEREYGSDIYGLNEENKKNIIEEIRPEVESYYSNVFQL